VFAGCLILTGCSSDPGKASAAPAVKTSSRVENFSVPTPPELLPKDKPVHRRMKTGTAFPVKLQSVIDSASGRLGYVAGQTEDDVLAADGAVAIPAGSAVTIRILEAGKRGPISVVRLGLYSVNVRGTQYTISDGNVDAATLVFADDAGRGATHTSVHLQYGARLEFRLQTAVDLN
jgi:hypothetical protein